MIIFSSEKLQKVLANDSLDSWGKAKYIIFVIAMYCMSAPFHWFLPEFGPKKPLPYHLASLASYILTILITVYGAKRCFRTNKTGDGKDFVERLAALYVPMTFEIVPLALVLFAITAYLVAYVLPIDDKPTKYSVFSYVMLAFTPFLTWLFFVLLDRDFERLAELIRERNESP
jgi:hypothetical protein